MLEELKNSNKVVGLKQVRRSVEEGTAKKVFLAEDVAPDIYDKIVDLCKANNVEIEFADSMKQLGNACKIDVSAAVAAIIL
ncbi:MAG: ribosomal L7Ae/L30e/S12e/Gadd45 family protein [Oscillospiraceae bacterium]|nr:ribosomal L7Ae/L30e/S12e/Gadd45 family protein [Oscillospiraceae bacterium]